MSTASSRGRGNGRRGFGHRCDMTLLYGGRVVTAERSIDAAVRMRDGIVTAVGDLTAEPGEEALDCSGCLLVPGAVETHTHLDLDCGPGLTTIDDFATGTRAALAGGTTTVLDFATQFHGQTLTEGLAHWHAKADGRAVTDYGFHMAMTEWKPEFAEQMAQVVADGVTSFKMYMAYLGSMMVTDDQILQALRAAGALGATIGFHCENGPLIAERIAEELAAGHTSVYYHPGTRPAEFEREAINRLGVTAGLANAMHYVVHLSSDASLPEIAAAREPGRPHGRRDLPAVPAARRRGVRESGRRPRRRAARATLHDEPSAADPPEAATASGKPSRTAGSSSSAPTTARSAARAEGRGHGLQRRAERLARDRTADAAALFVRRRRGTPDAGAVSSRSPRRTRRSYFGLYPRKGTIAVGSDADIVVIDPAAQGTVRHADLHDGTDHTPYEGMATRGAIRDVFLRGRHLVRAGVLADDLPPGRYLRRDRPDGAIR